MSGTVGPFLTESSKNPATLGRILWISKHRPRVASRLEADPFFQGWEWSFASSAQWSQENSSPNLILIEASLDPELAFMRQLQDRYPSSIRILLQDLPGIGILKRSVNRAEVFSVLEWPEDEIRLPELLRQAVMESEHLNSRVRLMRESTMQNRELEKLNASLESLVEERTKHIQISKDFEEEKVSRVRGLIRFIQQLSGSSSFEEILDLLRRDLRSFHRVHDPVLLFEMSAHGPQVMAWRAGKIQMRTWPHPMTWVNHAHLHDPEMSKKLANEFGRPFGKALVISLDVPSPDPAIPSVFQLVLENSLPENEIFPVLDFCLERLQPLCTAIERIRIETELTHSSFRWEKTFDGLRDPIAIIDRSDGVLRANKKFSLESEPRQRLERFPKAACYESFAGQSERCEGCPVPEVLATGVAATGQVRRGGRFFDVHSYPIALVPGGKPTNVVNQYVDLTRSREVYIRLLQSEKMGALGLLAGNIAHELNNPLTGLRSLAQVLIQEVGQRGTDVQMVQDLGEIEKAAERCQKIIRNLLDFVQQDERTFQDVSLDELVEKTLPFLKTALRMLRLQQDLKTGHLLIRAEPHLLQQVIFNLIHNACQEMGSSGTLNLETEIRDQVLRLWIRDTGPGVPEKIREKIFEPFFTTKKEGSGTGLGLSLSKEIVESCGGTIGCENVLSVEVPNKALGAAFWIEFPITQEKITGVKS